MNMSNTKTIAKNAGWYSVENIVSALVNIFSSIAIARTLGPSKTGYIIYVLYIAGVISSLGSLGIPSATRKYMAEFLGMGDKATARRIFFSTFALQTGLASLTTAAILVWVLHDANAQFRLAAILIALSIWPSMVNSIPAQANGATEDLSTNVPASIISAFVYLFTIVATILFHWGVTGIGAAFFLMRLVDFLVRLFPALSRVLAWNSATALPGGLQKRMFAYAWQSVVMMLLAMVVWERCEVVLLKFLSTDIRQVAYYSIAFSLGNNLLMSSIIFGAAAGTTMFVQLGRDESRLPQLAASSFRYLVLTSIPLHLIAMALMVPALLFFYGTQYKGAAMVVMLAPLLCMPKAFLGPIQSLLQTFERQKYVIAATIIAGVVDIGVAAALIPAHGAVGACIGNGVAQITAVGIMWAIGVHKFGIRLPWMLTAKVVAISIAAALAAHLVAGLLSPLWGILLGGSTALVVLVALAYLLRILEPEDQARFTQLTGALPRPLAAFADRFLALLIRAGRAPTQGELAQR
jgi:O-antigen/teichoic acid export membrane protein